MEWSSRSRNDLTLAALIWTIEHFGMKSMGRKSALSPFLPSCKWAFDPLDKTTSSPRRKRLWELTNKKICVRQLPRLKKKNIFYYPETIDFICLPLISVISTGWSVESLSSFPNCPSEFAPAPNRRLSFVLKMTWFLFPFREKAKEKLESEKGSSQTFHKWSQQLEYQKVLEIYVFHSFFWKN